MAGARPVILGEETEHLVGVRGEGVRTPKNVRSLGLPAETRGLVLMRDGAAMEGPRFDGVPDDNRSSILPDVATELDGRGYALCAKGVGARVPLYGDSPLDFSLMSDFGPAAASENGGTLTGHRLLTGELWLGEAPYGAQGGIPATQGLMVTELASGCSIGGFHICPVVEVVEYPPDLVRRMAGVYWYRRHRGSVLQEHRLMPSNVRLYHQSEVTLGRNPEMVLRAFGVTSPEALDSFLDRYISSGIAALTLFTRTMRRCDWGFHGLDYAHVWLDKDCVVAPDGTLHFADIEGLDWGLAGQDWSVEERVRDQFDRNFYEFMYGLDVLVRRAEASRGRPVSQEARRESMVHRFDAALAGDRFTRCETSRGGLDLVVLPPLGELKEIVIRVIDLR